ncbi:hypothetical protein V8F06_006825 [Rhypophila decipiens]
MTKGQARPESCGLGRARRALPGIWIRYRRHERHADIAYPSSCITKHAAWGRAGAAASFNVDDVGKRGHACKLPWALMDLPCGLIAPQVNRISPRNTGASSKAVPTYHMFPSIILRYFYTLVWYAKGCFCLLYGSQGGPSISRELSTFGVSIFFIVGLEHALFLLLPDYGRLVICCFVSSWRNSKSLTPGSRAYQSTATTDDRDWRIECLSTNNQPLIRSDGRLWEKGLAGYFRKMALLAWLVHRCQSEDSQCKERPVIKNHEVVRLSFTLYGEIPSCDWPSRKPIHDLASFFLFWGEVMLSW